MLYLLINLDIFIKKIQKQNYTKTKLHKNKIHKNKTTQKPKRQFHDSSEFAESSNGGMD